MLTRKVEKNVFKMGTNDGLGNISTYDYPINKLPIWKTANELNHARTVV